METQKYYAVYTTKEIKCYKDKKQADGFLMINPGSNIKEFDNVNELQSFKNEYISKMSSTTVEEIVSSDEKVNENKYSKSEDKEDLIDASADEYAEVLDLFGVGLTDAKLVNNTNNNDSIYERSTLENEASKTCNSSTKELDVEGNNSKKDLDVDEKKDNQKFRMVTFEKEIKCFRSDETAEKYMKTHLGSSLTIVYGVEEAKIFYDNFTTSIENESKLNSENPYYVVIDKDDLKMFEDEASSLDYISSHEGSILKKFTDFNEGVEFIDSFTKNMINYNEATKLNSVSEEVKEIKSFYIITCDGRMKCFKDACDCLDYKEKHPKSIIRKINSIAEVNKIKNTYFSNDIDEVSFNEEFNSILNEIKLN